MMKTMTDSEILEKYQQPFPVSFKVIGTGTGATDIIEKVKSFGYECIGCILAETPSDCIPMDDDKMVIIVAQDNEEVANTIAKTYHDAGVLTIGFINNATAECYDSIAIDARINDVSYIVKDLLEPLVKPGLINCDFNDLSSELRDSGFFKTLTSEAANIENAVVQIQKFLTESNVKNAEYLSAHIYFNHDKKSEIKMDDMAYLSNMFSSLPESVNAVWSVNFDDSMPNDTIRLSIFLSGKKLR